MLLLAAAVIGCAAGRLDERAAPVAAGATYYVAPTGSDGNAGTKAAPFLTIQQAANVVSAGDVVIVGDGVYTDHDGDGAIVRIARGGTPDALVTFRAANRWQAKLDGQNGVTANGIEIDDAAGYIRIEGFEIYGVANAGSPTTGRGSASGIDLYDGGHDSQIIGNHIHDIGRVCTLSTNTNGQVGVFVQQPNVLIEGNVIHDVGRLSPGERGCSYARSFRGHQSLDHAIYLNGGAHGANGTLIRNNILYNTRHGWAVQWYPGSLTNVHVVNNTFAFGNPDKNYTSIVLDASISASSIVNNIFYNPEGGRTIEIQDFSGTITIANNITTGRGMTDRWFAPGGMTLSNNQDNTDPLFVNAPLDFRLQATSPAIDAGQTLALVPLDFARRPRPQGARYDIGAYEH